MKQINIKRQMVTMTVLIGASSVIIGLLIIFPAIKNILQLQNDITETQEFLEGQYEKTRRMRRSVHSIEEISQKIEKLKNTTLTEGSELEIITQLENLALDHNVVQSLKVTPHKGAGNITGIGGLPALLKNKEYYVFSFSSEGTHENILNYLKALEGLPYYFSISSIQLNKIGGDNLSTRFDAILFSFNDEK